jgi:ribulose 1,5-bisphosphate carboxylase large subunit-like protein
MISANTETKTVEVKTTIYACDVTGCTFSARTEQAVVEHFGEKHAVKDMRSIGEDCFYLLDSEESWNAWLAYHGARRGARVRETKWHGPGWYLFSTWQQRCPRNCCYDDCIGTTLAADLIEERQHEIIEKARALRDLKKLLNGNEA